MIIEWLFCFLSFVGLYSIIPNRGAYVGGDNITFSGLFNLTQVISPIVECNFTNSLNGSVVATSYSDTEVSCILYIASFSLFLFLFLVLKGVSFSNGIVF
jgi:hypothetical protein